MYDNLSRRMILASTLRPRSRPLATYTPKRRSISFPSSPLAPTPWRYLDCGLSKSLKNGCLKTAVQTIATLIWSAGLWLTDHCMLIDLRKFLRLHEYREPTHRYYYMDANSSWCRQVSHMDLILALDGNTIWTSLKALMDNSNQPCTYCTSMTSTFIISVANNLGLELDQTTHSRHNIFLKGVQYR